MSDKKEVRTGRPYRIVHFDKELYVVPFDVTTKTEVSCVVILGNDEVPAGDVLLTHVLRFMQEPVTWEDVHVAAIGREAEIEEKENA